MSQIERIGRFEVVERIRGNSFALVYRGRDPFANRAVEIKVCVAHDEAVRRRFLDAAEDAATLRHPNVATIYEFGSGESKPYLVQEAFSERSLSDLLARGEHVEDVVKLSYLVQVCRGLHHAHDRGVLHRELRPASVLVHSDGRAKVADFGTARLASAAAHLGNGAHRWPAIGWLLPELILGLELDARSDIYAFGAVAYEVLTGQPPFPAETLSELVPQVLESDPPPLSDCWPECPPEIDRIVGRCLCRDPGQRFPNTASLIGELSEVIPVPDLDDIDEEEKTIVMVDTQTIFVTEPDRISAQPDLDALPKTEEENSAESVAAAARPSVFDRLETSIELLQRWFQRSVERTRGTMASIRSAASRDRKAAMLIAGLGLLLIGVIAWSWVAQSRTIAKPDGQLYASLGPKDPAVAAGLLIIDAQPWAEVSRLVNERGEEVDLPAGAFTPLPLELPPGHYIATLERPSSLDEQSCEADLAAAGTGLCRPPSADEIQVRDYFRETGWWQ